MTHRRKAQIHWREQGHGPALVLVNGWSSSGLAWPRQWLRRLHSSYRVIRPDNRGSGYSRFVDVPFSIGNLADDVLDVLDDAGIERATVFGLSMGGMIAQETAMRAPERVTGLVLAATRPPGAVGPWMAPAVAWTLFRPHSGRGDLEAHYRRRWSLATAPGFAERNPEAIAEMVLQSAERPTSRSFMRHQMRAATGWGRAHRLADITAPTVVVHGALDRLVDPAHGRRLAERIPGARYVEVPDAGHLLPMEAPDELVRCIDEVTRASSPVSGKQGADIRRW